MKIHGHRVEDPFTYREVFIEGWVESAEYPLDLQLDPFDFALVIPDVRDVHSPPKGPLEVT